MWIYSELAFLLANLFFRQDDFIAVAKDAGYQPGLLNLTYSAINNWIFLLHEAETDGRTGEIARAALRRKPGNDFLQQVADRGASPPEMRLEKRDVQWRNTDPSRHKEALITGQDTLLPISFLETGMNKAKCVVFIKTPLALGTGFLIRNDYLITNNHVIPSEEEASEATILFNYQRRPDGQFRRHIPTKLDPGKGFATNPRTDWTIVKLRSNPLKETDYLHFASTPAKEGDFVNIIQHPGGDEKKIGIYHNLVISVEEGSVQYLTDTQEGSSGSPVLNPDWEVVALHHSSVRVAGDGEGDELRNEGSPICVVKTEIKKAIPDIEF